ncbi:T9SS type A sorting domain-containing protein [Flavicella sediminum]|uniref:T9SS type A sorting domain-containing protein n=1 Tax=Flavicella sediminum TaxID=2585141 RepID=UPI00111D7348|nr:T9SS type A sorting domain-containing protein [Flavicella sediminum]
MKKIILKVTIITSLLLSLDSYSQYQVWLGTIAAPRSSLDVTDQWEDAARKVQGLNIKRANKFVSLPGTPNDGEENLGNGDEFDSFVRTFNAASLNNTNTGYVEIARTKFKVLRPNAPDYLLERPELDDYLVDLFRTTSDRGGYSVNALMFYDNYEGSNSENNLIYRWSKNEVQRMRDWLDANGRAGVKLYSTARGNSSNSQEFIEDTNVDGVVIEGIPQKWYDTTKNQNRQDLLRWIVGEPTLNNKRIIFQLPVSSMDNPYGTPSGFEQTREFVRWLGSRTYLRFEFLQNNRVVIMPVTYNPAFTFYPETENNGRNYANSMTGIALSLIEQKKNFQGLTSILPTKKFAARTVRPNAFRKSGDSSKDKRSIETLNLESTDILIYPNPLNNGNSLNVKNLTLNQNVQVEITDVTGKTIQYKKTENTLNLQNTSAGIYIVKFFIEDANEVIIKKLFIN